MSFFVLLPISAVPKICILKSFPHKIIAVNGHSQRRPLVELSLTKAVEQLYPSHLMQKLVLHFYKKWECQDFNE